MNSVGKMIFLKAMVQDELFVVEALRDAAPYVAVIGDAARVSTITNAVYWDCHAK